MLVDYGSWGLRASELIIELATRRSGQRCVEGKCVVEGDIRLVGRLASHGRHNLHPSASVLEHVMNVTAKGHLESSGFFVDSEVGDDANGCFKGFGEESGKLSAGDGEDDMDIASEGNVGEGWAVLEGLRR